MRQDIINTPTDSGLGDKLKIAFDKVNEMFIELYQQDDDFLDELNIIQNIIEQLNDGSLLNHTHLISQIIGLQTSLDSKLNITTFNTQISSINASIQQINTTIDNIIDILQNKIDEAPVDNTQYVRINATWSAITLSTGATGATGPQGIQGIQGATGATGSSLLQENVFDAYLGTRLVPVNTDVNGFGITKSVNGQIGLMVKNTDTSGNAALAAVTVGGDGTFYENGFSLIHYGANYYLPYLRNTGGLYSTNNFNFINVNNTDVDFRTGTTSLGSDTSKFRIAASGSLHIGVTPSTDNTISSLLGRKSTGEIVSYAISSIVGTTGPTGPQGATGSQGIQGIQGATGPAPDTSLLFDYFDAKPIVYQKHTNIPSFGSSAINNVEGVSILASGPVARNWADTDIVTRTQRMGLAVSTTGNLAQLRQTLVYLSRNGGFDLTTGFNMAENASDTAIRFFIGLTTNTIFTNVEPNTLLNIIGICRLSSSDNLHLINNDNTGTATTLDLGSNFPANTISTDKYLINIKTVSTGVYLKLDRIGTAFSYETTLTSDIPSTSTGLNFGAYIVDTTGANATTGFDWYGTYIII